MYLHTLPACTSDCTCHFIILPKAVFRILLRFGTFGADASGCAVAATVSLTLVVLGVFELNALLLGATLLAVPTFGAAADFAAPCAGLLGLLAATTAAASLSESTVSCWACFDAAVAAELGEGLAGSSSGGVAKLTLRCALGRPVGTSGPAGTAGTAGPAGMAAPEDATNGAAGTAARDPSLAFADAGGSGDDNAALACWSDAAVFPDDDGDGVCEAPGTADGDAKIGAGGGVPLCGVCA